MIEVVVRNAAGIIIFGPDKVPDSFQSRDIKASLRCHVQPGSSISLLRGIEQLADEAYIVGEGSDSIVELSAVIVKSFGIVSWGHPRYGGDSSAVAGQLKRGVISVLSSAGAFAVLTEDGAVSTWGCADYGGDSSHVAKQLASGVASLHGNDDAFAALRQDGAVVTWGSSDHGGDSRPVAGDLMSGVVSLHSTVAAFSALKDRGSVVSWGSPGFGGNSTSVLNELSSEVASLYATDGAFAALKQVGQVVAWGQAKSGGELHSVADQLAGETVTSLVAGAFEFVALTKKGSVIRWGREIPIDTEATIMVELARGVVSLSRVDDSFFAQKDDDSIVQWGTSPPARFRTVSAQLLSGIRGTAAAQQRVQHRRLKAHKQGHFAASGHAFAAIMKEGEVLTWGSERSGGDSHAVAEQLRSGVFAVQGTACSTPGCGAFVALRNSS